MTTSSLPDVLTALRTLAPVRMEEWIHLAGEHLRERILSGGDEGACRVAPLTGDVAKACGLSLAVTRGRLFRCVRDGSVLFARCPGGQNRWWPVGGVAAMRKGAPCP